MSKITKTLKRNEKITLITEDGARKTVVCDWDKQHRAALIGLELNIALSILSKSEKEVEPQNMELFEEKQNVFTPIEAMTSVDKEEWIDKPAVPQGQMLIDVQEFELMKNTLTTLLERQDKLEEESLMNKRLNDILAARRAGEDSEPTKADILERNLNSNVFEISQLKRLRFKHMDEIERIEYEIMIKNNIQKRLDQYGNISGSMLMPEKVKNPDNGLPPESTINAKIFAGGKR